MGILRRFLFYLFVCLGFVVIKENPTHNNSLLVTFTEFRLLTETMQSVYLTLGSWMSDLPGDLKGFYSSDSLNAFCLVPVLAFGLKGFHTLYNCSIIHSTGDKKKKVLNPLKLIKTDFEMFAHFTNKDN